MGAFSGPFSTYNSVETALNHGTIFRIRDVESSVNSRNNNGAEFYQLLSSARTGDSATEPRVEWGETDKNPNYLVVKTAATSGATDITVTDAYQAVAGDQMRNDRTGELIRIDAVDDADTISTDSATGYGRGFAGSTAAAMVAGDRLIKMGNVLAEEGKAADSRNGTPTPFWNYIQPFQKTWTATKLQNSSDMLDGVGQFNAATLASAWELDEEVNATLWFGRRNMVVAADGNLYTMNGFDQQVKTYAFDFSNIAVPSWTMLNEAFSPMFQSGASSNEKMFFCGQGAYSSFTQAARAQGIKFENYETLNGTNVKMIEVDGGTIHLVKDYRTFKGSMSGSGRIVDMSNIEISIYNGWDRMVIPNVQDNDQPTVRKDMAMQALTLKVKFEDTHGIVDGLSTAFNGIRVD